MYIPPTPFFDFLGMICVDVVNFSIRNFTREDVCGDPTKRKFGLCMNKGALPLAGRWDCTTY